MTHPMQQIYIDEEGNARFRENRIVSFFFQTSPFDMNQISKMQFSDEDRMQFAQLIGYSVTGFSELQYADDESIDAAEREAETLRFVRAIDTTSHIP